MKWNFKYGENIEIFRAMQDRGRESPLDVLPEIDVVEMMYYNDFSILGTERSSGMGVSSIPITKIIQYAELEGVHDVELFKRIMMQVDNIYMKLASDDQKRKSKPKAKRS